MKPSVDAICCDVDGTLYSIRRMVLSNLRLIWPIRKVFRDLHKVRDELRSRDEPVEDFKLKQAELFARRRGIDVETAARLIAEAIEGDWMRLFAQDRVTAFSGVVETLRLLKGAGLKLALLSDYPIGVKPRGLGFDDSDFELCVNTETLGALKPNPAAFHFVAAALALPPERILYVGDREAYDVDGALNAGMQAALIYAKRRPSTRASFAFRDWRSLPKLMRWRGMIR